MRHRPPRERRHERRSEAVVGTEPSPEAPRPPGRDGSSRPVVGGSLAAPVAAPVRRRRVPHGLVLRPLDRDTAALARRGPRPLRAGAGGRVLARAAGLPATPRTSPRPARPRRRRGAWAGPGPRRYPGARKQRCRDPGLVGPASPAGGDRPRVHAGHAPPAGHAAPGPLRGAGRRDPGAGGQRFRGGPRGLAPPGRRVRLANRPGCGARLPGRRLDRPTPLYAHPAADDRSRGRGAAPARAREIDGRGSGGRPGRRHHHGGAGPHGPAGAAQPAGRPA